MPTLDRGGVVPERRDARRRRGLLRISLLLAVTLATAGLVAHQAWAAEQKVRVGIMSGEDEDVWRVVAAEAAKQGLIIETTEFSDYTQPNEALQRDELDANAFQHKPYLDNQIKTRGYTIVPVGYTAVWPIGLYSQKHKSVADLPEGALIGVPNDPSNEGRALNVLQSQGLITLRPDAGILATTADITANPRKIVIKELDAGIVGRTIDDLDAAVVNTDWALKAGLKPETDRIAQEPLADNPYRNFIAVKSGRESEPWVAILVASYQNDAVKEALAKAYREMGGERPREVYLQLAADRLLRATYSEKQLQETMVDFWSNHFNVYARKNVSQWFLPAFDREVIRPHALGKFRDLLLASAQSPMPFDGAAGVRTTNSGWPITGDDSAVIVWLLAVAMKRNQVSSSGFAEGPHNCALLCDAP